jgi:Asp/Glu/hydantoin racemase
MTDLAARLSPAAGLPVVDGVGCGGKLIESRVAVDLRTFRLTDYAAPRAKP